MATLGRLMVQVGADISDMERGLATARERLAGFGSSVASAGVKIAALTAPIAAVGLSGLVAAGNFEKTMNVLGVTTGATDEELQALAKTALDLGKTTSFSALDAAEGLLALGRAGYTVAESQAAISGVLDLAAAAETDVGTAAKIAANAMFAFGLSAEEAPKIANLLAAGANASTIGIEDIANAVQNSGAIFSGYGQSIEALVESTAILGNKGFGGAEAGSTLKTLMTSLYSATKEQKKVLDQLGVSAYDKVTGQARPFLDVVRDIGVALDGTAKVAVTSGGRTAEQAARYKYLAGVIKSTQTALQNYQSGIAGTTQSDKARNKSIEGLNEKLAAAQAEYNALAGVTGTTSYATRTLTEEQKNLLKSTLAGSYGINALNALLGTSAEDFAKVEAALGYTNAATDLAEANTKGLTGAFEYFMGTMESLQIGALSPYLESLGGMIRSTADFIAALFEGNPALAKWTVYIGAAAVAAGPLLIVLGGLISGLAAMLSPLGLIIAGVALLATAWVRDWGGIQAKTAAVWAAILPQLIAAKDWLLAQLPGALQTLAAAWATGWGTVQAALTTAWATIQPMLLTTWLWLQALLPSGMSGWTAKWATGWDAIQAKTSAVWAVLEPYWLSLSTWFSSHFPTSLAGLQVSWETSWSAIQAKIDAVWAVLEPYWLSLSTWLANNFPTSLAGLREKWASAWAAIQEKFAAVWAVLEPYLKQMWDWLEKNKDTIIKIVVAAAGFFIFRAVAGILASLLDPFAKLASVLNTFLVLIINGVAVLRIFASVIGFLLTPTGLLVLAVAALVLVLGYLFYYDIGGFRTTTVAAFEALKDAAQKAYDFLEPIFLPVLNRIRDAAENFGKKMGELGPKFTELLDAIKPTAIGLGLIVGGALGGIALVVLNFFASVLEALPEMIGDMVDTMTTTLELLNTTIKGLIDGVTALIHGDWAAAWQAAKSIGAGFYLYYVKTFNNLWELAADIFKLIADTILNTLRDVGVDVDGIMATLQENWKKAWDAITEKLTAWKTAATGVASYLENGFKNAWNSFVDWFNGLKLGNPFSALGDWLDGTVKKLGDLLQSLNDVANWIGGKDETSGSKKAAQRRLPETASQYRWAGLAAAGTTNITVNVTVGDAKDKAEWRRVARMVAEEFERVRR